MLQERLKPRRDAQARAGQELKDALDAQRDEVAKAPANLRSGIVNKWRPMIQAKQQAVNLLSQRTLLDDLEGQVNTMRRKFPSATLVKDGESSAGMVDPLRAKRDKQPFADQWLLGGGVLLTLNQDTKGLVAGTVAPMGGNQTPRPTSGGIQRYGIVSGQAEGNTLAFTMITVKGVETKGRFTLANDRLSGTWEVGAAQLRVDRLDIGLPEASWFQGDSADFTGTYVHPVRTYDNTNLRNIRPGLYEATIGKGRPTKGMAAGNLLFMFHFTAFGNAVREATLSPDGSKLTFIVPGGGLIAASKVVLTKQK